MSIESVKEKDEFKSSGKKSHGSESDVDDHVEGPFKVRVNNNDSITGLK